MSDKIVYCAVSFHTESGDRGVHCLSYPEGYPETVAETLKSYMQDEFAHIRSFEVDVHGDYVDLETLGRKSRRLREEIRKAIDKASREYWGEDELGEDE